MSRSSGSNRAERQEQHPSTPAGRTDHLHADLRDPDAVIRGAARTLDFTQPVALILLGALNFVVNDDEAHAIVTRLLDALPTGSYLLLSHLSCAFHPEAMRQYTRLWNEHATPPITTRTPQQLTRLFTSLKLLEPGMVSCSLWRPDPHQLRPLIAVDAYCGADPVRRAGVYRFIDDDLTGRGERR